jgi:predicted Rossmann fold nucleotide-binding protein DprA/Smf involved in DNA uptake
MSISAQTQAILLLTAWFSKSANDTVKPLTTKEWAKFAHWLKDHNLNPEDLLNGHLKSSLQSWTDRSITHERIEQLMNRGSALALAMEKWTRAGLWVLTRSDSDYPGRLKKLLKTDAPAVLFGCGDAGLLNKGGIAVVGARNADEADLKYSRELGRRASAWGHSIISGGARGVDEAAMLGSLDAEGTVIGVMADSLLKAATSGKYRPYLMNKNLVLISTCYPEAGFNAGNAMSRNKYIYCLADTSVVVQSGTEGGTWNGAIENLKNQWVPMWVKETVDSKSGNALLIQKGALPLSADILGLDIDILFKQKETFIIAASSDIFRQVAIKDETPAPYDSKSNLEKVIQDIPRPALDKMDLYEFFLFKVDQLTTVEALGPDDLLAKLEVTKAQLNIWLKKATAEKKVKKISKPVRYQSLANTNQIRMFD